MHRYSKLLLASLTATAILAMAVGNASANRLSTTGSRLWRVTWTSLKLRNSINNNVLLCPVTLEGSFHSATIVKTLNSLVGYIKRATVNNTACTGGHATIEQASLPWHIRYRGYSGILPNITLIILGLVGTRFIIEGGGITCNATTTASSPALGRLNISGGVVTSLTPDPSARIPLEGGLCGIATGTFEEPSQTLTEEDTGTARITVTLIEATS